MTTHTSLTGTRLGLYHLKNLVKSGLWSDWYKATHTTDGSNVSIEVLHPEHAVDPTFREWWLEQSRQTLQLQGAQENFHWWKLLSVVEEDQTAYRVFQWVQGYKPLEEISLPFTEQEAAHWLADVCELLATIDTNEYSIALTKDDFLFCREPFDFLWKREALVTDPDRIAEQRRHRLPALAPEEKAALGFLNSPQAVYYSLGTILYRLLTASEWTDEKVPSLHQLQCSGIMLEVLSSLLQPVTEERLSDPEAIRERLQPLLLISSTELDLAPYDDSLSLEQELFPDDSTLLPSHTQSYAREPAKPALDIPASEAPTHETNVRMPAPAPRGAPASPVKSSPAVEESVSDAIPPKLELDGLDTSYTRETLPTAQPSPILEQERKKRGLETEWVFEEVVEEVEEVIVEEVLVEDPDIPDDECEASLPQELLEVDGRESVPAAPAPLPPPAQTLAAPAPILETPAALPDMSEPELGAAPEASQGIPQPGERVVEVMRRKGVVRYYEQMNPRKNFPLLVSLIEASMFLKVPELANQRQAESERVLEIKETSPHVRIVPVIPGCIISPAEAVVDVRQPKVDTEFWVSPQAVGDLSRSARIQLWHEGELKDEIPIPCRVTTQTWARLTSSFSVFSGVGGPLIEAYSKPKAAAALAGGKKSFAAVMLKKLVGVIGTSGLTIALVFFLLSIGFYYWFKPREGEEIEHLLTPRIH